MSTFSEKRPIFIAEAGVNHNGSLKLAKKMIKEAASAGADYIKFQAYNVENLLRKNTSKAPYQKKTLNKLNQYSMLKLYQMDYLNLKKINNFCKKNKIKMMLSAFDLESFKIIKKLKHKIVKIPSGELNNFELLNEITKSRLKVILSTGMSTNIEIKKSFNFLIKKGVKKSNICLLHCCSDYPTKITDVNLKSIDYLKKTFKVSVGLSDHSQKIGISLIALGKGISVIEKHFTLNKKFIGPDHDSSLDIQELYELSNYIKNYKKIMGKLIKKNNFNETKNKKFVRKSIVAKKKIKKGEIFSNSNITAKRPEFGISISKWFDILNTKSKKNYEKDDYI